VELQLQAVFNPSEGLISFTAVLSPNSYVIDPACHLTGGFAMFFWFGKNPHAGDFVLTLGGYSPYFKPPNWYPMEPRLGFNWALDSHVSISGGAYFALTPSALMAGGALAVQYKSGNLRAWFTAHADIIIWWNPFKFLADIGVSVGASYKVDLLFTSKTFKVELGANLTLWGPPTGGKVRVHWWVISFTVHFGSGQGSKVTKQTWDEFKAVLPKPEDSAKLSVTQGLTIAPPNNNKPASLMAAANAQGEDDEDKKTWMVRSDSFEFSIESAIPASELYIGSDTTTAWSTGDKLNIKPMEMKGLTSSKRIVLKLADGTEINLLDSKRLWTIEKNTQNVPTALWGTGSNTKLSSGEQLVKNQLSGYTLTAPKPELGASPGVVSVANSLSYDPLTPVGVMPLKTGLAPSGPAPQQSDQTLADIGKIMGSVKTQRDQIYAALGTLNLPRGSNGDLTKLQDQAGALFVDQPLLVSNT
jgi:hypothetical protein